MVAEQLRTYETKPNPDPTVATNDAVERAMKSERDYVNGQVAVLMERLSGIDEATKLRLSGIESIPEQISVAVEHLSDLVDEKFISVAKQFLLNDTALVAALAAQKEAASKQDEANQKAIAKSEAATNEAINKLAELFRSTIEALDSKVNDFKETTNSKSSSLELQITSAREQRIGAQAHTTDTQNLGKYVIAIIGSFIGIAGFITTILVVATRK